MFQSWKGKSIKHPKPLLETIHLLYFKNSYKNINYKHNKQIRPSTGFPAMDWINIATAKHKCRILHTSSCQNELLHPPSCILQEGKDSVWISGEGLPQQIIISLEEVEYPYQNINAIAITCSHDYETNPKIIQIWVVKDRQGYENQEFIYWDKIELRKRTGRQMFSICEIPESERIIKLMITETYGEFETYMNQVMLLAEPDPQTSQSLFNQEEWHKINIDSNPIKNNKNSRNIKSMHKTEKNIPKKTLKSQQTQPNIIETSPLQLLQQDEIYSHGHQRQRTIQIEDMDAEERSYQKNAAMLAMSKNMIIMEDNIEQLNRKVQILEKKVDYTYQNLQNNIMTRVQQMIDKKIERKMSEKQLFPNNGLGQLRSYKDLTTSRTMNNMSSKQKQKQKKVMNLVSQLNGKLKQRTRLANKLDKKLKMNQKARSQYYD